MEQNLHELFGRALADEPPPADGSAREAMARGRRIRRRRWLAVSASTAAAVIALVVGVNVGLAPRSVTAPAADDASPSCLSQQSLAYLRIKAPSSAAERLRLEETLTNDPAVLSWLFDASRAPRSFDALDGVARGPSAGYPSDGYLLTMRYADVAAFVAGLEPEVGKTTVVYQRILLGSGEQANGGCVSIELVRPTE